MSYFDSAFSVLLFLPRVVSYVPQTSPIPSLLVGQDYHRLLERDYAGNTFLMHVARSGQAAMFVKLFNTIRENFTETEVSYVYGSSI